MGVATRILFKLPIHSTKDGAASDGQIICTEPDKSTYLLTFNAPPDNRLTSAFCDALILALDILEHRFPPGPVLTTSGITKFYSNGMDIAHAALTPHYLPRKLYALWRRVLTFPAPTLALLNGHAFAGGLMLAAMHDYRVMNAHRGYLCLNELELGMPLRAGMVGVFRLKLGPGALRKAVLEAHRFGALEALREGLVDHVGGLEESLAFVREMGLVAKSQVGASGKSVVRELKQEMYKEEVRLLQEWAEENVEADRVRWENASERDEEKRRVEEWERDGQEKAKL